MDGYFPLLPSRFPPLYTFFVSLIINVVIYPTGINHMKKKAPARALRVSHERIRLDSAVRAHSHRTPPHCMYESAAAAVCVLAQQQPRHRVVLFDGIGHH